MQERVDQQTGEIDRGATPAFDADAFADRLNACKDSDTLDLLTDEIRSIPAGADTKDMLAEIASRRRAELQQQPATRRNRAAGASME